MKVARTFPLIGLLACAPGPPGQASTCPNDLPSSCNIAPSYQGQVAPAIASKCLPCHQTGANQQRPLDTYTTLAVDRDSVRMQLQVCAMPPAGLPQLTAQERLDILQWIVCGAPNN